MKLHFPAKFPVTVATLCCLGLGTGVVAFRAQADQWDKKTVITVNERIQVRDTVLDPGQYVFKLVDSNSDRHIVQITNSDQTHVVNTILAIPNERLHPTGKTRFSFWETPPGNVRAMRAWFPPGELIGQEFPYPKQLARLEMAAVISQPRPVVAPQPIAPQVVETPVPAPQPEPRAVREEPVQPPVQIAQNTPPPAVVPERNEPASLPKSATPYPTIGLGGLLSLGLFSVLRLKRMA